MFTSGQLIFAVLFFIAFVIIVYAAYQKDIKLHKKYYRGNRWLLLAILVFIGLLFLIKFFVA
mgnify:CR=1 FL=1